MIQVSLRLSLSFYNILFPLLYRGHPVLLVMATGGGSDNNDRPRRLRKREHEHLLDDNTESTRRPKSNKVPRRMGSEPVYASFCYRLSLVG